MGAVLLVDGLVRAAMGFTLLSGLGRCFVGPIIFGTASISQQHSLDLRKQSILGWLTGVVCRSISAC